MSIDATGLLTTPVKLNGRGPYQFVLDTGSEWSAVSEAISKRAKLRPDKSLRINVTGISGNQKTGLFTALTFDSPVFHRSFERLVLIPNSGAEKDGILGANAFGGKRLELDFAERRWRLQPSGPAPEGFFTVPLEPGLGGKLAFRVTIDGVPAVAVIDTGTRRTIANMSLAQALGLADGDPRLVPTRSVTGVIASEVDAWNSQIGSLAVGDLEFLDSTLTFADLPWWEAMGLGDEPAIVMGLDQFMRLRAMAIDYSRLELQLKP